MEQEELRRLEDQCIQEQPAGCSAACPVRVDVRAMMAEAARGNFTEAAKILGKTVPFPGIISRVCEEPCRAACKRSEAGESLSVRAVERACLDLAAHAPEKISVLPRREKRVAVVGGGLSGLTAAFDLARKGYTVVVFEQEPALGGSLRFIAGGALPSEVMVRDLEVLGKVGVEVHLGITVGRDIPFDSLRAEFEAVYVGIGPEARDRFGLEVDATGAAVVDPVTFATSRPGVFAGGGLVRPRAERSPIHSISDGRRAAISIDRFAQRVSLTASRSGEGPRGTRLFTSIEGVLPSVVEPMADPDSGYSQEEAAREAARCLQCQCLECVKVCEYLNSFGAYPRKYVRQIYNNLSIVMGHRHANKLINSCSLCGLCREVCPENLHMGLVCREARRTLVSQGKMPPSAHDFPLRDLQFSNSERCAFARHQPGTAQSRFLFFPGCQLNASAPHHVQNTYALLSRSLAGGVGFMARCCGAPADWTGRTDLFESACGDFLAQWWDLGSPELILACSTCYEVFKSHLPEVTVRSLWEVLDGLGLPESARSGGQGTVAVHDACTTRNETSIQESVRRILQRLGFEVRELELSRDRTECCGYGGLMFFANRDLAGSAIRRRIQESSLDYVAYCAMCRDFFASQGKRAFHLLDLFFGAPLEEVAQRRGPGYSQRHENRVRLKNGMLREFWGERTMEAQGAETIRLRISNEVRRLMEDRLILVEDLQKVIDHAEKTGIKLFNRKTGRFLAHHKPAGVTYWVEYAPSEDGFVIYNAYSHRMEIEEGLRP